MNQEEIMIRPWKQTAYRDQPQILNPLPRYGRQIAVKKCEVDVPNLIETTMSSTKRLGHAVSVLILNPRITPIYSNPRNIKGRRNPIYAARNTVLRGEIMSLHPSHETEADYVFSSPELPKGALVLCYAVNAGWLLGRAGSRLRGKQERNNNLTATKDLRWGYNSSASRPLLLSLSPIATEGRSCIFIL